MPKLRLVATLALCVCRQNAPPLSLLALNRDLEAGFFEPLEDVILFRDKLTADDQFAIPYRATYPQQ